MWVSFKASCTYSDTTSQTRKNCVQWNGKFVCSLTRYSWVNWVLFWWINNSYDPETRTWTDLRAIESLKMQFSAVSVHNELYVGYKERTTIKFYKYSTTTNLWTAMESIEFSGIVQATIQLLPMKDSLQVLITTETEIEIYENTLTGLKWREVSSLKWWLADRVAKFIFSKLFVTL